MDKIKDNIPRKPKESISAWDWKTLKEIPPIPRLMRLSELAVYRAFLRFGARWKQKLV